MVRFDIQAILAIVFSAAVAGPLCAEERPEGGSPIAAPGAKLEKLAGGFSFTEGPTADVEGNVYFTDQPNDRIHRWGASGDGPPVLSTWLEPAGRSNGLCFDAAGNLWACADGKNELWRIAPDKSVTVVLKDYQGKRLNGPNDLWIRPDGGVYFTDPFYKRPYWNRDAAEQERQAVYFLAADGKEARRVADDLEQPNGLVGTPDGKTLYVADIKAGKTYAFDVRPDGSLAGKRLFCEQGSDGMTLDEAGRVYLTGRGVSVYGPDGGKVDQIDVPESWTANVCFGGPDMGMLFVTAGKGLYALKTRTRGASPQ